MKYYFNKLIIYKKAIMNSYVCKSNNKDVKLKFVEKNGKIFLEVINIEKNNRLNCWNIQQLKLVNDNK